MKNKYLVVGDFKEFFPNVTRVYPLNGYTVGFNDVYTLDDLSDGSIIIVNRLLDDVGIMEFKSLIPKIVSKCEGIIFEDLGILELLKDEDIIKIFMPSHSICSKYTLNEYLKYVDIAFISPDITYEEIEDISKSVKGKIGLNVGGLLPLMYSRRKLKTNYENYYHKKITNEITENITKMHFIMSENEFGTVIYDKRIFDGRRLLNLGNIAYYFMNIDLINNKDEFLKAYFNNEDIGDPIFLDQKTIYKLGGDK